MRLLGNTIPILMAAILAASPASAQKSPQIGLPSIDLPSVDLPRVDMPSVDMPDIDAPTVEMPRIDAKRGALLIHGNFCGPGNRGPGHPPVDRLDVACMHHDACTPPRGELPTCACNERLHAEAGLVARDPRTPRATRDTAQFVSDGALVLPCAD